MSLSRRQFLKRSSLYTAGGLAALNAPLSLMPARAADVSGYKAIVCINLLGGMDCHDTLIPYDQGAYDEFVSVRQELMQDYARQDAVVSRARSSLLPLSPLNAGDFGGRAFALPGNMTELHSLFESGNAAILTNIGPLIRPVTAQEINEDSATLPPRLFSHNDQQSTWMSLAPEGASIGWGGRIADAVAGSFANGSNAFTAISASGGSLFLSGDVIAPFPVTNRGGAEYEILRILEYGRGSTTGEALFQATRAHVGAENFQSSHLIERDMAAAQAGALANNEAYAEAFEAAVPFSDPFPNGRLGNQLERIARSISIRGPLNMRRQVFYASTGGFDTHSNQAQSLPNLHAQIDAAVGAFYRAMQELGVENDVVLFTSSDFGRTLAVNGDGTDHGWGAHHFVVGGGVRGRRLFGNMPPPIFEHENDAGGGRLVPSTSVDQFIEALAAWFGLTPTEIAGIVPNLPNFGGERVQLF